MIHFPFKPMWALRIKLPLKLDIFSGCEVKLLNCIVVYLLNDTNNQKMFLYPLCWVLCSNHHTLICFRCSARCFDMSFLRFIIIASTTYFTAVAFIEINYITVFDNLKKKIKLPQTRHAHMFHVLCNICDLSNMVNRINFYAIVIGLPKKVT